MSNPVSSSTATPLTPTPSSPLTGAPIGAGASTTSSLTSAAVDSSQGDYWDTVKGYAVTLKEFIRNLVLKAAEGLRSGLGALVNWIGGSAVETPTPPVNWEIPATPTPTPLAPVADPFQALPINDIERQKIFTVIHSLGTSSWWTLLTRKAEIEKTGEEIQQVHPLRFLDYIFRHPTLSKDMEGVASSSLTWNPFVAGLAEKLRREAATLPGCKIGFARSLNVSLTDLEPYFARSEWEGMVRFLMDVKSGKKTSVWVEPTPPTVTTVTANPPSPAITTTTPPPPVTTNVSGATTTTGATLGATTTSAAASTTVVIPNLHLADLPFDAADDDALSTLARDYAIHNSMWLTWHHTSVSQRWQLLGARHPLKILAALSSKPPLMAHLQTILSSWINKPLFKRSLSHQLSHLTPAEVLPYLNDFAAASGLDADATRTLIEHKNWSQIIDDLHRTYVARV